MITQQMIDAGLAAKVRDYRADDADEHIKSVEQAMHEYGFHHPIDGGEMVRAILEAALPTVAELVEAVDSYRSGESFNEADESWSGYAARRRKERDRVDVALARVKGESA